MRFYKHISSFRSASQGSVLSHSESYGSCGIIVLCTGFACKNAACEFTHHIGTSAAVQHSEISDTASLLLAWVFLGFWFLLLAPSLETLLDFQQHQPYKEKSHQTLLQKCMCKCKRPNSLNREASPETSIAIRSAHLRSHIRQSHPCTEAPEQLHQKNEVSFGFLMRSWA